MTHQQQARAWIEEALALAGHPGMSVELSWSARMWRTLGRARHYSDGRMMIRLASKPWELLPVESRRRLVFHEVAHLVAYLEHGKDGWGHGRPWHAVMARLGYPDAQRLASPEDTAAVAPLRRPRTRVVGRCGCDEAALMTQGQARKARQGVVYRCRDCRQRVTPTGRLVRL